MLAQTLEVSSETTEIHNYLQNGLSSVLSIHWLVSTTLFTLQRMSHTPSLSLTHQLSAAPCSTDTNTLANCTPVYLKCHKMVDHASALCSIIFLMTLSCMNSMSLLSSLLIPSRLLLICSKIPIRSLLISLTEMESGFHWSIRVKFLKVMLPIN